MKKWSLLFLVGLFMASGQQLFAQTPLDKRLDFKAKGVLIKDALLRLSNEAQTDIAFSSRFFPEDAQISIRVKNTRLEDILQRILQGYDISYQLLNKQIYLYQKPPPQTRQYTISGYLSDQQSGEKLIAASIFASSHQKGTITNEYGFYSLTLPEGFVELRINYLGSEEIVKTLELNSPQRLDIQLESIIQLEEVVVRPPLEGQALSTPIQVGDQLLAGYQSVSPDLGGEKDIIRTTHLLAGVQTGADGLGGIYVRGGESGQNLMLLDGVPIYNANHLLGMFSIYNFGAVKSAKLLKGHFPARYGGRISSIFDVRTKDGHQNQWHADAGMGLMTARATVEGPLPGKKGSIIVSGRSTHWDFLTKPILETTYFTEDIGGDIADFQSRYNFHDFNAKVNWKLSPSDQLFFSYYNGKDSYEAEGEEEIIYEDGEIENSYAEVVLGWGNEVAALRWNHLFSDRLFSNTTLSYSLYDFQSAVFSELESSFISELEFYFLEYQSQIRDFSLQSDFERILNPKHYMHFGGGLIHHRLRPYAVELDEISIELEPGSEELDSIDFESLNDFVEAPQLNSSEAFVYFENEMQLGSHWQINAGLRLSALFEESENFLIPEPRLYVRYSPTTKWQFQASVSRMAQYLHKVSPNGLNLPNDIWIGSSELFAPQKSWQTEIGLQYKPANGWVIQLDAYQKSIQNLLLIDSEVETVSSEEELDAFISPGDGQAYGIEWSLRKEQGQTGGWLNYTYAKSTRQSDFVNLSRTYNFQHDSRHFVKLFLFHRFSDRLSIGLNWLYNSPKPFLAITQGDDFFSTLPLALTPEGQRNSLRGDAYHRMDVNLTYLWKQRKLQHTFKLGIYNVYNFENTAFHRGDRDADLSDIAPVSIIGFMPSIYYQIKI
ncbi:MAG: TonB-dependent receptor [Bacteroidota bacterium]